MTPEEIAEAVGRTMFEKDAASRGLGMALDEIAPGYARMSMRVREDMLNGHAICHGGFIFTLADSTFAFACNSYNQNTVAQLARIDFCASVRAGVKLVAEGRERRRSGRTGVYDITVKAEDGVEVALFRGNSYTIKGQVIPGLTEDVTT
jgi:acyl-CoA thioesterase